MSPYFEFKRNTALNKEGNSNKFACWSNKRVHRELGFNNTRSLGTADSSGFSVATSGSANSGNSSTTVAAVPTTAGLGINRGTGNDRKKGYKWGATRSKGFCLPDFSSPQKRWRSQTSSELEGSKQVHCRGALQDGGISHGKRSCETRGLVGKIGSKRCLLSGTSRLQSPEVSSVPVAGQSIPVSLSAIRPILCPSYVYKVDETSGGFSEGEGNQTDHISGRLTNTLQLPGHVAQPTRTDQGFVSDIGLPHQQQEVPVRAITGDCVSGPNNFDHCNASVTTQGESDSDPTRGPANAFQNRGVSTEISSLCGHDNGSETGSPGGSTVSSPLTSSDKQSSPPGIIPRGSETEISSDSRNFEGGLTGIRLVDARNAELQQGSFACGSTRSSDRVRCISLGLGSNPERSGAEDRWSVVNQQTRDAHQLFRATSGIPGNSDFCQGEAEYQYFSEDRQCVNQGIHKSLWRDPLMANESLSHTDMEVVYRSENIPTAEHLPGIMNQVADEESRTVRDRCDWMIHPHLFAQIERKMGPLEVDMFASRLTHQLPRYFSWRPDPAAEATDAFSQVWSQFRGYANPPWCLLLPTLAKIQRERARVVLVAPMWKTQPWYPLLLQLLRGTPLLIPIQENVVISPTQEGFIMPSGVPQLAVWPLSSIKADQEGFQKELRDYWNPHGGIRPSQHTSLSSNAGIADVWNGIEIPLGVL